MSVTKDEVKYIASLAKLYFSEDEIEQMTKEMDALVSFADTLSQLDTDAIDPTAHIQAVENVFRVDGSPQDFPTDKALSNAPEKIEGCFAVPKVVE